MTAMLRELVAGMVAAVGLLGLVFSLAMPWWLAVPLAGGLYVGLRTLLPASPAPHDLVHAGGVTEAERRALVKQSQRHLSTIRLVAKQLTELQPTFAPVVQELCQLTESLLAYSAREPRSVGLMGLLPMYLEKMAENLQRYVDLAQHSGDNPQLQQRLVVTQEMVQSALTAFERLRQRLYRDDWIALEAEAETLKALFESDLS
jgi:hypothetical protein